METDTEPVKAWPPIASTPTSVVGGNARYVVESPLPAGPTGQVPEGEKVLPPPAQVMVTPVTKETELP